MAKKDSDHQDFLDLACHFGNFPRGVLFSGGIDPSSKQGCLNVNRKNQLKHEMPPNNSELDVQKKHGDLILSGSSQRYFFDLCPGELIQFEEYFPKWVG